MQRKFILSNEIVRYFGMAKMDLREWVECQRDIDHKFSLKVLSAKLKIHPTTLSRILSGKNKPRYWLAQQIEKVTQGKVKAKDIVYDKSKFRFCECGRAYKLHR